MALFYIAVAVVSVVAAFLYVWFVKPQLLIQAYGRVSQLSSGSRVKRVVDVEGVGWEYLERGTSSGNNPTILFVHGFSSRKEDWGLVLMKLPPDQHVIVPDLLGHGNTDRVELQQDVYQLFIRKLHQFVAAVGLDSRPFHIVGLSMGGAIVLHYAADYPDSVAAATIACPAIATPQPSEMTRQAEQGWTSPLSDYSIEGTRRRMRMVANRRIPASDQIIKGIIESNKKYQEYFKALYAILRRPEIRKTGIEAAERVTSPSQVIWGDNDQLIHVSGAEVLREKLPNLKAVHVVPECGHAVMLDKPQALAQAVMELHRKIR